MIDLDLFLLNQNFMSNNLVGYVWHYLRYPTFSHFDRIRSVTDSQTHTDRHTTMAYTVLA